MALTRTTTFSLFLFLVAAVCGTASLLYLLAAMQEEVERQDKSLRGDIIWLTSGAEREARLLRQALKLSLPARQDGLGELRRLYEHLGNSVERLGEPESAAQIAAFEGGPERLAGCRNTLHLVAPLLAAGQSAAEKSVLQAEKYLDSIVDGFATLSRQAREHEQLAREETGRRLRWSGWLTLLSAAVVVASGAAVLGVFLRNQSRLNDLTRQLEEKIEERTRLLRESSQSLKMMSQAIEQSPVSVIICNVRGEIEYVNPKFVEVTGYSFAESAGRNPRFLQSGKTSRRTYEQMWQAVRDGRVWQGEICNRRKNGELFWEQVSLSPIRFADGRTVGYLAVKEDISERKIQEEELIRQANYDSLTGLPNRLLAMDRLQQATLQAERRGHKVALLFIDLDNFKQINDMLGHESGDQVLREAAERLLECLRDCDTAARFGGDEFIIILSELHGQADVVPILARLLEAFGIPFEAAGQQFLVTASIGVSLYPDDSDYPADLLKMSDTAMYLAKNGGKNRYCFHRPEAEY